MQIREFGAKTIIVRIPNWVGDAVMATPALRALREAAPDAHLLGVATPSVCRLLAGLPHLDELLPFQRRGAHRGLTGLRRFARELHQRRPALTLVLPHSFSSALLARLIGCGAVAGYATLTRRLLLSQAPWPPRSGRKRLPRPMTRHYLELLHCLGIRSTEERMELAVSTREEERCRLALARHGVQEGERLFAANPGSSFGASKFWTVEGFAQTIRGLAQRHGYRTLVLCGPGEEELAGRIAQEAGEAAIDTSREFLPLELLKPVLRDCELLITTDTGPRHIAAAFGTPQVVLMGPTDPRYSATNLTWARVLRVEVDCGPCHKKICPLDHRCMTRLEAGQALEAADQLLERVAQEHRESLHA